MDADILRLILFLAGISVVLGIYLWDRYQKKQRRTHAVRSARPAPEPESAATGSQRRQEPQWEPDVAAEAAPESEDPALEQALEQLEGIVQDERPRADKLGEQTEFSFEMDDARSEDELGLQALPTKILQLNIRARKGGFSGDAIMNAARDLALEADEMEIFHCVDERRRNRPIFSMASMVEPGTFPLADMSGFNTPGVTLFAQLQGERDGMKVFDAMLESSERLAALLDGEIQDETHSNLSKQTIEHIREAIREYNRLISLAGKR